GGWMSSAVYIFPEDFTGRGLRDHRTTILNVETAALDCSALEPQTNLMTVLQEMETERLQKRERLRLETRRELHAALGELVAGRKVIVFGSLVKRGRFTENSDIDVAFESEPKGLSLYQLTSLLAERLGRRVDVVLLPECRFRDKILREGEA